MEIEKYAPCYRIKVSENYVRDFRQYYFHAAALLKQAGWKRGSDGVRSKDGQRLKVVYQTSVNPLRQKTQAIVKKAFEEIGIEVELKAVNAGVYFSSDPGNPDTASHFYTDIQKYVVQSSSCFGKTLHARQEPRRAWLFLRLNQVGCMAHP